MMEPPIEGYQGDIRGGRLQWEGTILVGGKGGDPPPPLDSLCRWKGMGSYCYLPPYWHRTCKTSTAGIAEWWKNRCLPVMLGKCFWFNYHIRRVTHSNLCMLLCVLTFTFPEVSSSREILLHHVRPSEFFSTCRALSQVSPSQRGEMSSLQVSCLVVLS